MRKKLFRPIQIGSATALIAITSFLSYGIGLIRDRVIAVNFGTTSATDTYNASFIIPDLLFNLFIAGALTAAFLPIFTEYLVKDKKEAHEVAHTMLTTATLLIAALSAIAFIFIPYIIPALFPEATSDMQTSIIVMTRLMLPSAVLFAISNTLGNILMSYKHFLAYALSPIFYNVGIIGGVMLFNDSLGIYSAATGVLIGATLHTIIRVADAITTEYKFKPSLNVKHPGFKKILKLMLPKSISLIAWQINLLIFAKIGMQMLEGGLAAFHFARNIQSFAVSLFGISFATAVFPFLTTAAAKNDKPSYTAHIQKTIQRILFFTIPAMTGLLILAESVVDLILSGGIFEEKSVSLTAIVLLFFAISIPFESLTHIFARAFYALKDTLTPMIVNITSMAIIALITIFVAPKLGIEWFSIGFSIGFIFYNILMIILIRKHLQGFKLGEFSKSIAKTILASGLMAIALLLMNSMSIPIPEKLLHTLRILIGAIVFFSVAYVIKSPEISSVGYILNRIFKKKAA